MPDCQSAIYPIKSVRQMDSIYINKSPILPPKPESQTLLYDVIIVGAGIAGLWLGNVLKRGGYNVIVIEKDAIGSGQTLASQGMIHGGQKYTLTGKAGTQAASIAEMPARWEACFGGFGDVDLTGVEFLSDTQVMWPAGDMLASAAVFGAAKLVNAKTRKLKARDYPEALAEKKKFKGPVYELPEKVMDVQSLLRVLAKGLKGRIFKGDITEILPDGQVAVSGKALHAQVIVFTAGTGNEDAFRMLNLKKKVTQRRPLRQVMVRPVPYALYGHGITASPKPRLTVTSYKTSIKSDSIDYGEYLWYLGGAIAEEGARMTDAEAIAFAQKELMEVFPDIDWSSREWATWLGDRAEPFNDKGDLPPGPHVQQRGRVLAAWPVKLTFAPALADRIMAWLRDNNIMAASLEAARQAPLPDLPQAEMGRTPWEVAQWRKA